MEVPDESNADNTDENVEAEADSSSLPRTSTKVDRHGFIMSHRLHSKVSSSSTSSLNTTGREGKWLAMLSQWSDLIKQKDNKIKERCRKGIPQSLRSLAWQNLTGANILRQRNPDVYRELQQKSIDSEWNDTIRKDIPRTFRHHSMFSEGGGQGAEDLFNVLSAFSTYETKIGYNQALAPVAAVLLMHMSPEESFWMLVSICRYYLPGYYDDKMDAIKLDGKIFGHLLESINPEVSRHMKMYNIDPLMYIVEWMICVYARCLPFDTVLRIWDMFFCVGVKYLFKVGLAILKLVFPSAKELDGKDDYQTTQVLNDLPRDRCTVDILLPVTHDIKISEKHFVKIHKKVLDQHPELQYTRFAGGAHHLDDSTE